MGEDALEYKKPLKENVTHMPVFFHEIIMMRIYVARICWLLDKKTQLQSVNSWQHLKLSFLVLDQVLR